MEADRINGLRWGGAGVVVIGRTRDRRGEEAVVNRGYWRS